MRTTFLESETSIWRRTKEISSYWVILWMKHQRALKLLNCFDVVVMTIFPWSILHKICSRKINALLILILITWWFSSSLHNLLLSKDNYVQMRWNSLCGLTKMQHHLYIPTWYLIWNQTLRKGFECKATFSKIHNMYILHNEREKEPFVI